EAIDLPDCLRDRAENRPEETNRPAVGDLCGERANPAEQIFELLTRLGIAAQDTLDQGDSVVPPGLQALDRCANPREGEHPSQPVLDRDEDFVLEPVQRTLIDDLRDLAGHAADCPQERSLALPLDPGDRTALYHPARRAAAGSRQ